MKWRKSKYCIAEYKSGNVYLWEMLGPRTARILSVLRRTTSNIGTIGQVYTVDIKTGNCTVLFETRDKEAAIGYAALLAL